MILLVPIHLDALSIDSDQPVLEAKADFTRLPYTDGTLDVNGDIAYISEEIVSEPFQDQNLYLKAGIHLHWALPDALTRGAHTSDGTNFPEVPNRWLITRRRQNGATKITEKQWVVESDYLYPIGAGDDSGAVSYPIVPAPATGCPFRFLGRKIPLEKWKEKDPQAEYLKSLTAVGYGEPTFAAFYPNCHSVFGFHDDYTSKPPDGLQYEVIGWYSEPGNDCLRKFLDNLTIKPKNNEQWLESIKKEFKWTVSDENMPEFPAQTLCYARLTFKPKTASKDNTSDNSNPDIAVANTGTEALSAYLASKLADANNLKSNIEDQLEALSFSSRLNNRQLDVGAKLREARHEKGFSAVSSGTIWSITLRSTADSTAAASAEQANLQAQITLPRHMADDLNNVNRLQQAFDRALEDIESMRRRLFSDWYKYLLCAYPPDDARDSYPNIDEVKNFIEVEAIAPLKQKIDATGDLKLKVDKNNGNIIDASLISPGASASELVVALNSLFDEVARLNDTKSIKKANVAYSLKPTPGARYYQPNDPVVLLAGDVVKPSLRHGHDGRLRDDGLLECQLLQTNVEVQRLISENPGAVIAGIDDIEKSDNDNFAFVTWTEQPWNPFLLEWEAEVFPVENESNLEPQTGAYSTDFIKDNFRLNENDVDFSIPDGKGKATRAANVYSGSSILTPHAGIQLQLQIEAYLKEQLLQDYYAAKKVPSTDRSDFYFTEYLPDIKAWYRANNCEANAVASTLCNIIDAHDKLIADEFHSLSQSLGGFNEALLMHRQTLQLDIADPLGFDDYRQFANDVKKLAQQSIVSAPQPLNDFNPIRSGAFELLRLRLVDTFGQVRDINCEKAEVIITEQMKVDGSPHEMTLPTRLTQPARINFRWLSAVENNLEMNDHPATSPICGWVLPNNLDSSLMIYDADGKALGSINALDSVEKKDRWEAAPGSDAPLDIEHIENSIRNLHLRKMVLYLVNREDGFLGDFLTALDNALENIEPENFAQHQDIALLMGSPIAVVRASVDLELQGLPAIHQGWNVFRQDLNRNERDTNDFDKVKFPIRLGEYKQFNDGTVGYWIESAAGDYEGDIFYAPQSDANKNEHIKTYQDDSLPIRQTVTESAQNLTILMDPRGSVHATSGILPVKAVSLPPDQYADALKAIEITFLSAPILTELNKLRLPLPVEPGFQWSWLQKEKEAWTEITSPGIIKKQVFLDAFSNGDDLWSRLQTNGWINQIEKTNDVETAEIVSRDDQNRKPDLGSDIAALMPQIESLLGKAQIGAVNPVAAFSDKQEILEGWLKLRNASTIKPPALRQQALRGSSPNEN
jgi:hypothetical protein